MLVHAELQRTHRIPVQPAGLDGIAVKLRRRRKFKLGRPQRDPREADLPHRIGRNHVQLQVTRTDAAAQRPAAAPRPRNITVREVPVADAVADAAVGNMFAVGDVDDGSGRQVDLRFDQPRIFAAEIVEEPEAVAGRVAVTVGGDLLGIGAFPAFPPQGTAPDQPGTGSRLTSSGTGRGTGRPRRADSTAAHQPDSSSSHRAS